MSKKNNGGDPGNAEDRRRRRVWLLETYRSDMDWIIYENADGKTHGCPWPVGDIDPEFRVATLISREPTCRCYRCGELLTLCPMTVDRIVPGCKGGTYRRNNIRPSCSGCATETGNALKREITVKKKPARTRAKAIPY